MHHFRSYPIAYYISMINNIILFFRSNSVISRSFIFFIIMILCTAAIWGELPEALFFDSSYFSIMAKNFDNADLSTWHRFFTLPNSHDTQYRPLGFIGYFFLMGKFFNHNILPYKLLAVSAFSVTSFLIFRMVYIWNHSLFLSFLVLIFICFTKLIQFVFIDYSCIVKYGFTGIFLLFGIGHLSKLNKLTWFEIWSFFILSTCLMMMHEGTIVFPLIFVLILYARGSKILDWRISFWFIPSLIYFFTRLLYWPKPSGIMLISTENILRNIGIFSWSIIKVFTGISLEKVFPLALIILIFAMCFILKIKNTKLEFKKRIIGVFMFLIPTSPFLLLSRHSVSDLGYKIGYWSILIAMIFLPIFVKQFLTTSRRSGLILILYTILILIKFSYPLSTHYDTIQKLHLTFINQINDFYLWI